MPRVLLDRTLDHFDYSAAVFINNEFAVYSATEYIIRHGHRSIACISGPMGISKSEERLVGYRTALKHYGIPYNEQLVRYGKYTMEGGYENISKMLPEKVAFTSGLLVRDRTKKGMSG